MLISRNKLISMAVILLCLSLLESGFLFYQYRQDDQQQIRQAIEQGRRATFSAADTINKRLQKIELLNNSLAAELSSGKLPYPELNARLKQIHADNPDLFGVGAAFAANTYSPDTPRFAPYWTRKDGQQTFIRIEDKYDYILEDQNWYQLPITRGPSWIPPYYGRASQAMLAVFSVPFYRPDPASDEQQFAGVVIITFSLDGLEEMITSLDLGSTGYGFILSPTGQIIAHPSEVLVKDEVSIFELAKQQNDSKLQQLGNLAVTGKAGFIDHPDRESGHDAWYFSQPISTINGALIGVFFKQEVLNQTQQRRQQMIKICIALVIAMQALVVLLALGLLKTKERILLACSIGISMVLVLAILATWHIFLQNPPATDPAETKIVDPSGLKHFLAVYAKQSEQQHLEAPAFIPTGTFLQSIQFLGGNNVLVTGYMWQRYSKGIHDGLARGFVLPEAETLEINEAYHHQQGEDELIGWYFKATLREHFAYHHYPFDHENVWLRIWHRDFDRNVVLVPDLKAYTRTNPSSRPGIESDFVLPGWDIENSYFSYRKQNYNTNFGITNYVGQEDFPELYFNVHLQRKFTDPFLSKLVPLLVVSIMLFTTFLVVTKKKENAELTGFNVLSVVAGCTALFFVVIFDHISLRERLEAPGVVYLEYFYFILYFALLSVSINSVLFVSNYNINALEYHDNFLSKSLFWPVLLSAVLIISWLVFY